jgi:hypothetical protein
MSDATQDFSSASTPEHSKTEIAKQLESAIKALNFDLDEFRATKRGLAAIDKIQALHGSDWRRVWNRSGGIDSFHSEEEATATQQKWQTIVDSYRERAATGLNELKRILALGADPTAERGRPLYLACRHGNIPLIVALHAAGASLERRSFSEPYWDYFNDPLEATWACGTDHVEAARLLIHLGCQPSDLDVYWARQNGSHGVEAALKAFGFEERAPNRSNRFPWDFGPL